MIQHSTVGNAQKPQRSSQKPLIMAEASSKINRVFYFTKEASRTLEASVPTTDALLNGHAVKLPWKYLWSYLTSTLIGRPSMYNGQQPMQRLLTAQC